jgi:hypothetical protein
VLLARGGRRRNTIVGWTSELVLWSASPADAQTQGAPVYRWVSALWPSVHVPRVPIVERLVLGTVPSKEHTLRDRAKKSQFDLTYTKPADYPPLHGLWMQILVELPSSKCCPQKRGEESQGLKNKVQGGTSHLVTFSSRLW